MNKHILVTGSREWVDAGPIEQELRTVGSPESVVHHGGARGADTIAARVAERLGMTVIMHPAQWSTHGKRAGFLRNKEMVELKPEIVLAFQRQGSTGTQHTIDLAREAGIPVHLWTLERKVL